MRFLALPALWVALLVPGAASFSLAPLVPASPILAPRTLLAARHAPPTASEPQRNLPFFLDIETKGGIVFWSIVGIVAPFIVYNFLQDQLGLDVVAAGNVILVGYVGLGTIAWTSTYVFRVANKDMTYAKQLRDYENAVIQKRFEELNNDEVDALMEEIYPEQAEEKEQKAQKPPAA